MTGDRRNPYVILGVPFGADESAARIGFAQASRRLRSSDDGLYAMEDLTWALHQVEQMIQDPTKAFDVYRVPADASATDVERPGVFKPEPVSISRGTQPTTGEESAALRSLAIHTLVKDALTDKPLHASLPNPYERKDAENG